MKKRKIFSTKKGDISLWIWMAFALVPMCFCCIYLYLDVIITTEDGIAFWYALIDQGSLNKYYVSSYPFREGRLSENP